MAKRKHEKRLECKADYLEFTVPAVRLFEVMDLMTVGGVQPLDRGWRGYDCSALVAGGLGRMGWHDDPDKADRMGVHVSLGSQALAFLAGADDRWLDVAGVLQLLREELGGHITRLDLAWDDKSASRSGFLDLDVIEAALAAGDVTTRFRGGDIGGGWGSKAGKRVVYMGSGSSDASIRCYDKRVERLQKGHGDQVEGVGHWVRVELQLRRKRADAAAAVFQRVNDDPGGVFRHLAGVLRGYVDFKQPNAGDSNKRRWETAGWWSAFLAGVEKARLAVEKLVRTIEHVKDWIASAVGPSLALVLEGMGKREGWRFLFDCADDGRTRWGGRHRAILAASAAT